MTTDRSLMERADRGELDPAEFTHARHVELAFEYLRVLQPSEALVRMEAAIRRVAAAAGAPDKYHATITWGYLVLISERMRTAPDATWPAFAAANQDLFEPGLAALLRYYTRERLLSPAARHIFVLPDARDAGADAYGSSAKQ